MKSDNYVVIQGWMCNELELKGNELLIFALIYGFSQDKVSRFMGSRNYMAETFNITLPTVDKALHSLLDKQYICKQSSGDYKNPDIYWINFEVVKNLYMGSKESLYGGSKESLPDKYSIQKNRNKEKSNSKELLQNFEFGKPKEKKPNLYSKCIAMIDEYTEDPNIRKLLVQYLNLRLEMKDKPMYANQWKGLLNKLSQCINEDNSTAEDIIKQSIEKGYATFYPITNKRSTKEKPWEQGVTSERFTEEDDKAMREFLEKMKKEGRRTEF